MNFLKRRVLQPLMDLLAQGTSPRALAASVSAGLVIALFPVLGVTTLLSAAAALRFKLNMAAIQAANYAAFPLQILLFIPFFRAGGWLFNEDPGFWTVEAVRELVRQDPWAALSRLWTVSWHAALVWALVAGPAFWILLRLLAPVFESAAARLGKRSAS